MCFLMALYLTETVSLISFAPHDCQQNKVVQSQIGSKLVFYLFQNN